MLEKIKFWLTSSTGEGLSKRAVSVLTILVAIFGYFGINAVIDVEGFGKLIGETFTAVLGLIGLYNQWKGWARAIQIKKVGGGKYRNNVAE